MQDCTGGAGALLSVIGAFVPYIGGLLSLAGLILLFVAVKTISDLFRDREIFKNYLVSFLVMVAGTVLFVIFLLMSIGLSGFFSYSPMMEEPSIMREERGSGIPAGFVGLICASFIILWVSLIIGAFYMKKSYDSIARYTGVDLFRTTALVNLIGAFTIIILIGAFLIIVARIMEIIAYFSLPDSPPGQYPPPPPYQYTQTYPGYPTYEYPSQQPYSEYSPQ